MFVLKSFLNSHNSISAIQRCDFLYFVKVLSKRVFCRSVEKITESVVLSMDLRVDSSVDCSMLKEEKKKRKKRNTCMGAISVKLSSSPYCLVGREK